jgi:hypothetical protein
MTEKHPELDCPASYAQVIQPALNSILSQAVELYVSTARVLTELLLAASGGTPRFRNRSELSSCQAVVKGPFWSGNTSVISAELSLSGAPNEHIGLSEITVCWTNIPATPKRRCCCLQSTELQPLPTPVTLGGIQYGINT